MFHAGKCQLNPFLMHDDVNSNTLQFYAMIIHISAAHVAEERFSRKRKRCLRLRNLVHHAVWRSLKSRVLIIDPLLILIHAMNLVVWTRVRRSVVYGIHSISMIHLKWHKVPCWAEERLRFLTSECVFNKYMCAMQPKLADWTLISWNWSNLFQCATLRISLSVVGIGALFFQRLSFKCD